ncbi:hypothetical protein ASPCAL11636 [Aspergillus calidoustus]|uniref:Uncharacterized protein n=1 Tax=Aspergillus calidoustus TaxID=454130 RepID=A0A0U5GB00_ASPCI|nr:hypothetical protein ASPCAL11636 [Aspergillus calidoustus]
MTQSYALQYAMCLHMGFGVSKSPESAYQVLQDAGISNHDFQTALVNLKAKLGEPVYHESAYQKLLLEGYDLSIDYSRYYDSLGRSDEALAQNREDLTNLESFLGRDNSLALSVRTILCDQLLGMKRVQEALTLRKEFVDIRKRTHGNHAEETKRAMLALAAVYVNAGMVHKADKLFAELMDSRLPGLEGANQLRVLSLIRRSQNRLDDAIEAHKELLTILFEKLNSDHPDSLEEESRLCTMLINQKNYDDSGLRLERVVETCKKVLGPNNKLTLTNTGNLAYCYDQKGEFQRSVPLYRQLVNEEAHLKAYIFQHYVSKLKAAEKALEEVY